MTQAEVADFIDSLPQERRDLARALHETVSAAAPDLEVWVWQGKMWGGTDQTILGYGSLDYVNASGTEVHWFLIGLANQKAHMSLYVNAARDGVYLGKVYAGRLGKVKVGSAAIGIRHLEDIDRTALADLVKEAVANSPTETT